MDAGAPFLIPEVEAPVSVVVGRRSGKQRFVAILLGALLVAASLLKFWSQTRHPPSPNSSFVERPAAIDSFAMLEAVLATLLVAGLWRRAVWCVAMPVFGAFAVVAAVGAMRGQASCGCFGDVRVRPAYTMVLDLAAVVTLLGTGVPRGSGVGGRGSENAPTRRLVAAGITLVWLAVVAVFWFTRPAIAMAAGGNFGKAGELVVLEPEKWAGQRFSLGDHIDTGSQLADGRWIVLLVHHDCDHCAAAVPRYVQETQTSQDRRQSENATAKLAVIELPPFGDANDPPPWELPPSVLLGHLDQSRDWFATTPVAVEVKDGVIVADKEGQDAETPDPKWWQ